MMNTWPTLDQVKTWLNITGTQDDAWLTHKMAMTVEMLERYCNRTFPRGEYTDTFDGTKCNGVGVREIVLKAQPVIQVIEVIGTSSWHLTQHGSMCFPGDACGRETRDNVSVRYNGGFDPIPATILDVFYNMIGAAHSTKGVVASSGQVKKETVFGVSAVEYAVDTGAGASSSSKDPSQPAYYSPILDSYVVEQV